MKRQTLGAVQQMHRPMIRSTNPFVSADMFSRSTLALSSIFSDPGSDGREFTTRVVALGGELVVYGLPEHDLARNTGSSTDGWAPNIRTLGRSS